MNNYTARQLFVRMTSLCPSGAELKLPPQFLVLRSLLLVRFPLCLWIGFFLIAAIFAGSSSFAQGPQLSLAELKEHFRRDPIQLEKDIPLMKRGQFNDAAMQLQKENFILNKKVVTLVKEHSAQVALSRSLTSRLKVEAEHDAFIEKEKKWFLEHAIGRMKRVEHYQKVFKNPVLDEATVLYAGAPLCVRPDFLTIPANTLLVNFSYPVPAMGNKDGEGQESVMKYARLMTKPLTNPRNVYFAVLRRSASSETNKETYQIMDIADAGEASELLADEKAGVILYEWTLPTILRSRTGDFLAVVLGEDADVACDLTGQGRFGMYTLAEGKKVTVGKKFLYGDFEISGPGSVYSCDESATFSLGFLGWTSED